MSRSVGTLFDFSCLLTGHVSFDLMTASASYDQPKRSFWKMLLVALIPVLSGGWLSGPQSTFDTKGPVAESQLSVFYVTLWVAIAIFIVVGAVLAYATLKFKARSEADEHAEPPPQGHGNPLVELSLIVVSVLALVIIAVPTLKGIWYTYEVPEDQLDNAYDITAVGHQWWFKFEYTNEMTPGAYGGEAPLVTANELVIPAGRPIRVKLRTVDVIHSFWVPKLAGKVDMIPNRGNHLWLQADEPGYFWGSAPSIAANLMPSCVSASSLLPKTSFPLGWPIKRNSPGPSMCPMALRFPPISPTMEPSKSTSRGGRANLMPILLVTGGSSRRSAFPKILL